MRILLDLFCGAGGASAGYYEAGFDEIIGIDINPQPNYPFKFIQEDVTRLSPVHLRRFNPTAIHASPPCQAYSTMTTSFTVTQVNLEVLTRLKSILGVGSIKGPYGYYGDDGYKHNPYYLYKTTKTWEALQVAACIWSYIGPVKQKQIKKVTDNWKSYTRKTRKVAACL